MTTPIPALSTATKRTTTNAGIVAVLAAIIVAAARRLGINLDTAQVLVAIPIVIGVVTPFLYRAARVAEVRWPLAGYLLFGSGEAPAAYTSTKEAPEVARLVAPTVETITAEVEAAEG